MLVVREHFINAMATINREFLPVPAAVLIFDLDQDIPSFYNNFPRNSEGLLVGSVVFNDKLELFWRLRPLLEIYPVKAAVLAPRSIRAN